MAPAVRVQLGSSRADRVAVCTGVLGAADPESTSRSQRCFFEP